MPKEIQVRLELDGDEADERALREAAEDQGLAIPAAEGFEPITTILLAGGGAVVVGTVLDWLRRRRRSGKDAWGQMIDLRQTDPAKIITRNESLEFGQIVVITPAKDGAVEVTIETYDPDNNFVEVGKLVFEKLADASAKSIEAIGDAAKAVVGDKGTVSVKPA